MGYMTVWQQTIGDGSLLNASIAGSSDYFIRQSKSPSISLKEGYLDPPKTFRKMV